MPGDVRVENLSHSYGSVRVLHDIDLVTHQGELMTLLGPSGSGKSTLLRIVGGLEHPDAGAVMIGDHDMTLLPPEHRDVGVVFQNYALFPHMTVAANVAFPLRMRRLSKKEAARRVHAMLELVELQGLEQRRPGELSGGQQQRVALARALVFEPRVLLLDEPFGALDRRLREQLGLAVRRVQRELGITTIFVTHDQDEAFAMSTRIAVMSAGRILQVDEPGAVYGQPATLRVARLLGQLNEFDAEVVATNGKTVQLRDENGLSFVVDSSSELSVGRRLRCGVRPEHVRVAAQESDGCVNSARVLAGIFGGTWTRAQLDTGHGSPLMARLPQGGPPLADGDPVFFGFESRHGMLFDASTEVRVI